MTRDNEVVLYGEDGEPVKLHLVGYECRGYVDEGMIGFVNEETGEHQTLALMESDELEASPDTPDTAGGGRR